MNITIIHKDRTKTALPVPTIEMGHGAIVDPAYQKFHMLDSIQLDLAASTPTCFCKLKNGEERTFSLSEKEMAFITLVESGKQHPLDLFSGVIYPHIHDKKIENILSPSAQKELRNRDTRYSKDRKKIDAKLRSLKKRLTVVEHRIEKGAVFKQSSTGKMSTLEKINHRLFTQHSTTLHDFLTEQTELKETSAALSQKIASLQTSIGKRKCALKELTQATDKASAHKIADNISQYQLRLRQLNTVKRSIQTVQTQLKNSADKPGSSREQLVLNTQLQDLQNQQFLLINACNQHRNLIPPVAREIIELEKDLKRLTDQQTIVAKKILNQEHINTSLALSPKSLKKLEKYKMLFDEKPQLAKEISVAEKELGSLGICHKTIPIRIQGSDCQLI